MMRRAAIVWLVLLAGLALGGCTPAPWEDVGRSWPGTESSTVVAEATALSEPTLVGMSSSGDAPGRRWPPAGAIVEGPEPRYRDYMLDTGDRLRVFVYGQPNLSRIYPVDQSGSISVPLIGAVRARGLTTFQLEGSIRTRLSQGLVRDPQVTVDVQQTRPFFILGEVRNAGQFPYVPGMTVQMAVAIAGGYGERANERTARLTRRVNGISEAVDVTPDAELEPGDTVYIYERFF